MTSALPTTVFHNPDCGTSRNALALLRLCGVEPRVVEYLTDPPGRERLRELIAAAGLTPREAMRHHPELVARLGLDDAGRSDADLLGAMARHPILINRPLVVTPAAVSLCRPSETVLDLVPTERMPTADAMKDDGTPFIRDEPWAADDDLTLHLEAAGLPTGDLREPGRTFFRYGLLGGTSVGFGGFERHGSDALLRSLCVAPRLHRRGIGRNMALLLMRRAFDRGARRAFAFAGTPEAVAFFRALRFVEISRDAAPASILATRQTTALCPASAALFTRPIAL